MAVKLPGSFNFNSETIDSFNNYFREVSNKNSAPFYSIGKQKREAFKPKSYTGPADVIILLFSVFSSASRKKYPLRYASKIEISTVQLITRYSGSWNL